jgi:hypothetical protein
VFALFTLIRKHDNTWDTRDRPVEVSRRCCQTAAVLTKRKLRRILYAIAVSRTCKPALAKPSHRIRRSP